VVESRVWRILLWMVILLHFAFFLIIGMSRHWGYISSINDLGVFDQVIWNTLNGNIFQTSINPFGTSINWLGFHFQPILLLFVPLYALSTSVEWLTIAQAGALAITAFPVFLLARHIFQSEQSGFIWALVYLVNPFVLSAEAWDFHPITLAVPFIALGFLAILKKQIPLLILSCLVILTCKEHFGLAVAGFGFLWWYLYRSWKIPIVVLSFGIGHLLLVLCIVMPAFSPINKPIMLGEQLGQLSRYSWLGKSLTEIFQTFATQPYFVWKSIIQMGGLAYWGGLASPFLIIFPFIGFPFLLPGLGDLAANTLSANPMPRGIWAYHSVSLIPVFTIAAIVGIKKMSRWQKKLSHRELSGMVLTASMILGYFFLPLPLLGAMNLWAPNKVLNWPDKNVQAVRSLVGQNASISVQANIGAHFSQRRSIYVYPDVATEVDAIILYLASPTTNINNFPEHLGKEDRKNNPFWLDGLLQMDRTEYLASIELLLARKEYGISFWSEPWLVLSKIDKGDQTEAIQKVNQLLKKLRSEWHVDSTEYRDVMEKTRFKNS